MTDRSHHGRTRRAKPGIGLAGSLVVLLTACWNGDDSGVWAPDTAACAPGSPGRIAIGRDTFEQTVDGFGPQRGFAVIRPSTAEDGAERVTVWTEFTMGPETGIYRWTFEPLDDGGLRRVEVAVGVDSGYEPLDRPALTLVRCPQDPAS